MTTGGHLVKLLPAIAIEAVLLLPVSPASAAVPRFGHVFLIVCENTSYSQVTARHSPYLSRVLRPKGAWLTNYRTFTKSSSLGQYIATGSGQYSRCEAGNALPARCHQALPNLFGQLAASGRTWRDWQESMPRPCYRRDAGTPSRHNEYGAHHNPALYFTGLRASCRADNLPMGGTGAKSTEPSTPRSPAFGDDGVIIATWDEGADAPKDPGHVGTLLLGSPVRPGVVDRTRHTHYGLERTLAAGFGVKPLARAKRAKAITTIWR